MCIPHVTWKNYFDKQWIFCYNSERKCVDIYLFLVAVVLQHLITDNQSTES